MTTHRLWSIFVSTLALAATTFAAPPSASDGRKEPLTARELAQGFRNRSVIAKPLPGVDASALAAVEARHGAQVQRTFGRFGNLRIVHVPGDADLQQKIQNLRQSGLYEYVEPDYVRYRHATPNDPRFSDQWSLRNTGQKGGKAGADISATTAWDVRTSAPDLVVAIIDTGIRATHEDLAANLWTNPKEVAGNGIDDDGNGYIDDVHGINALVEKGTPNSGNPNDDQGHGTSVAGVVGAVGNNGKGIAGVAWQVKLMALKFDDREGILGSSGYVSNEVECIDYAIANGAKIINISYGSKWYSQAEYDAVKRARDAGIIVVSSAGNEYESNEFVVSYPASYALENVVSVANTDQSDALNLSSTYGALVELAAPGTAILTTDRVGDTDYHEVDGTSFSSPMVAGALSLLRVQFPNDSYRQVINRLLRSVDPVTGLSGKVLTGGRLNLQKALVSSNTRPFNDDFANRSILVGETITSRGVSTGATTESGEPTHAAAGGTSLWWSWTAPRSGSAAVDTRGSSFDTTAAVYTGSSLSSLTSVASNDDAAGRNTSLVTFTATANTTYHVAVDGKGGASGMISLLVNMLPQNDNFADAITLTGVSAQTTGTNLSATRQQGEPTLSTDSYTGVGNTVWYRWVAPRTDDFTVSAYTDSFGAIVGVFKGTAVNALSEVSEGSGAAASFEAVTGETYYFAVDSLWGSAGTFTISVLQAYAAWDFGVDVSSSPVIGPDTTVLAANDSGYLFCLSGSKTFYKKIAGDIDVATPTLSPSKTIYLTTSTGLYALDTNETILWQKDYESGAAGSPSIGADGTVYAHSNDGRLHAYTSDGTEKWSVSIPGLSYSSPSIGGDGTVYLGSDDHYVYAVTANGSIKWRFNAGDEVYASVAIGADGTLYVGTLGNKFYAIDANGNQKWSYTAGGPISSSAALGVDGTVYFGCYDSKLYALTSTGSLKWTYMTGGEIRGSSPAVDSTGVIYIGSYDGKLHAVNADGSVKQTYPTGAGVRSSPLIYAGNVLFGSGDGMVYFLYPGTQPASSNWPMHRQNAVRTGRKNPSTAPAIHAQPASRSVAIGGSVTLSVTAEGQDTLTFQWYFNGAPIAGATQSTYTITNASDASAGNYTVVVTNALGSVTSSVATVKVAAASDIGRIINLSARAVAGADAKTLIVGLVVRGGSGPKDLLIRGVGPELAARFDLTTALKDPKLTLFNAGGTSIASNDNWGGTAELASLHSQVGAFAYSSTSSKDAALATALESGAYTVHVNSVASNTSGVALAEFYDATQVFTNDTPRLVNISARSEVGRGADVLIVGFVIGGSTPKTVLIRGVGPTLIPLFDLKGALVDPKIELRDGNQNLIDQNDNWGSSANAATLRTTMSQVGAFALENNSKDAVLLVTLQPGAYTAVVSGVNDTTGIALAEVYEVE